MESGNESAQITIPQWVPAPVRAIVHELYAATSPQVHRDILTRLATDGRMRAVWRDLRKRNRQSGEFFYPAKLDNRPLLTRDRLQDEALAQTLHFVFCATRDRRESVKYEQIEKTRQSLLSEAAVLRNIANDLVSSAEQFAGGNKDMFLADADALLRVAAWRERIINDLAGEDDPHVAINERGDRLVRGVQIDIASFFQATFGNRLDGLAAVLTDIALGTGSASPRISRSAFSRPKTAKEADC